MVGKGCTTKNLGRRLKRLYNKEPWQEAEKQAPQLLDWYKEMFFLKCYGKPLKAFEHGQDIIQFKWKVGDKFKSS